MLLQAARPSCMVVTGLAPSLFGKKPTHTTRKKLLTTASNAFDTLRQVRFTNCMLNGFKFSL